MHKHHHGKTIGSSHVFSRLDLVTNYLFHGSSLDRLSRMTETMAKETTVFMDEKESTDLYPPTLKGAIIFVLIVIFSCYILYRLNDGKNNRLYEEVAIDGFAIIRGPIKRAFHGPYAVFLGIPFAEAPVRDLRFKYPQPLEEQINWQNKTFIADSFAPACHHFIISSSLRNRSNDVYPLPENHSEDCLYLNVYVPVRKNDSSFPHEKLPVMIWIHGGAFLFGSAVHHDPSEFATSQNVIIVTIQYRLGILGFAQTTDPHEIPGNMGLMDQVAALKWIKKNIHHFQGDPSSITLIGESAGAISVGYHMISNQSIGLFNRAILQSGAPLTMMHFGAESGPLWMEKVAIELRCPIKSRKISNSKFANFKSETYSCLRSAPIDKLLQVERFLVVNKKCSGFLPSVDHENGFFGRHPIDQFKQDADPFKSNVNEILLGHNGGEGVAALSLALPDIFSEKQNLPNNLTYELIKEKIIAKIPDKKDAIESIFKAIIGDTDKSKDNSSSIASNLSKFIGDASFYCPNLHLMDVFLKNDKRKAFYYVFNARPVKSSNEYFKWADKALHAEEIQFVFGYPFIKKRWNKYTDDERRLSLMVMAQWSSFAKTGKPASHHWKACQEEDERGHMIFDNNRIEWHAGLPENECSEYFESLYEDLVNRYKYMGNL